MVRPQATSTPEWSSVPADQAADHLHVAVDLLHELAGAAGVHRQHAQAFQVAEYVVPHVADDDLAQQLAPVAQEEAQYPADLPWRPGRRRDSTRIDAGLVEVLGEYLGQEGDRQARHGTQDGDQSQEQDQASHRREVAQEVAGQAQPRRATSRRPAGAPDRRQGAAPRRRQGASPQFPQGT